jgi:hypothetical protein
MKGLHMLFGMVRQCELRPDGHMYAVLIRALLQAGACGARAEAIR